MTSGLERLARAERQPGGPFWATYGIGFLLLAAVYAATCFASGEGAAMAAQATLAAIAPNALGGILVVRRASRLARRPGGFRWVPVVEAGWLLAVALFATAGGLALLALDRRWLANSLALAGGWPSVAWQTVINLLIQLAVACLAHAWHAAARAAQAETLQARAQLAALRSQLNPHFLLNTLHALLGLVRRDPDAASSAVGRLTEMLRFGLRVQREDLDRVAFRDEWAFVRSYLSLEQLRFGRRLEVVLEVAAGSEGVPIPPFALQTLVENAVNHGVAPRRDGGWLRVKVARDSGRLRVVVEDDGPGAGAEEILASSRLGLRLLRDRLAVLYGDDASLVFARGERGGLLVRLDLPADRALGGRPPEPAWRPWRVGAEVGTLGRTAAPAGPRRSGSPLGPLRDP